MRLSVIGKDMSDTPKPLTPEVEERLRRDYGPGLIPPRDTIREDVALLFATIDALRAKLAEKEENQVKLAYENVVLAARAGMIDDTPRTIEASRRQDAEARAAAAETELAIIRSKLTGEMPLVDQIVAAERARDKAQAKLEERRIFPIMHGRNSLSGPRGIPWALIAPQEAQAKENHGQSLERLASRGGLSPAEAVAVLEGHGYRGVGEAEAVQRLDELVERWARRHARKELEALRTVLEKENEALKAQMGRMRDELAWCVGVIRHGGEPPRSCGACGTPNANCDAECADAFYFGEHMRKATVLVTSPKMQPGETIPIPRPPSVTLTKEENDQLLENCSVKKSG